jgi:hypothetical protein
MPKRKKILRPVLTLAFFVAVMIVVVPALPGAFAHGGHQPPAADFSGKKVSLFVNLEPLVVTDMSQPVYINARLFDQNTNANFQHVNYRIFFKKDGREIPIVTEGGQFGGRASFTIPRETCR